MIHEVLGVFKDHLNAYVKLKADVREDMVEFIDGSDQNPIVLPLNKITPLIVNIQEDRVMRENDYYLPKNRNGLAVEKNPEIRIRMIVLFIARFKVYDQGLRFLSLIIQFFQANRLITRDVAPELPVALDRVFVEILNLPVKEQNEIWNSLHTSYVPSVAFDVGMIRFADGDTIADLRQVEEYQLNLQTAQRS